MFLSDGYTGTGEVCISGIGPSEADVAVVTMEADVGTVLSANLQIIALEADVTTEVLSADSGDILSAEVLAPVLDADACGP
jgi:hypothetical protein